MVTPEQIVDLIKENDMYPKEGLDLDTQFSDQGIDSLDITNIFLNVEETFGVELPEGEEGSFNTINKMVKFINEK